MIGTFRVFSLTDLPFSQEEIAKMIGRVGVYFNLSNKKSLIVPKIDSYPAGNVWLDQCLAYLS